MKTKHLLPILGLFSLLLISIEPATSQVRFGVRGGFDVISKKIDLNILKVENRLGYQLGPTVEFIIPASGFGADISVLYGRKEYEPYHKNDDITISDYDYISVPINIKKRFGLSSFLGIFITGGAYGNVKVSGGEIKHISDVIDEYKAKDFAFGLNAGAGVSLLKHFDIGMYFRGDLTKRYGDEHINDDVFQNKKNQTWSVALNYYF